MKPTWICAWVLCAFVASQYLRAAAPDISLPRWVIIATAIDRATGKQIVRTKLAGRQLEFNSAAECNFVLQRIQVPSDEQFVMILTCSKIPPPEEL